MTLYKLLVVDDEEIIRKGLCARIEHFGFSDLEVLEAASGAEALALFERETIHIALVDISMSGMSGLEMIRRLREQGVGTQFVLISGFSEFAYAQQGIALGVRAYLNKPVSNEVLKTQIEGLLRQFRGNAPAASRRRERTLERDLEREVNILLSGMLQGASPAAAFPTLCERYPGLFSGEAWIYLGLVHIGRAAEADAPLTQNQINNLVPAIRRAFEAAACDCDRLIVSSYQHAQRQYALFIGEDGADLRHKVESVFLAMLRNFESPMHARVTMGVSRRMRVLASECVSEAHSALRQRRVHGRSNIYFYEDITTYETQAFPEAGLELLRKHMMRGDRAEIQGQLEALFSQDLVESCKAEYLHVLWVRVVSLMMSVYHGIDSATMDRLLTQIARVDSISDRSEMVRTLTELIDRCLRQEAGRELSVANKIEVALEYMRAHYNEDIVINDLAARLDMSPGYFSSMFKKEARQSAMQYLTSLRMRKAMEYLENTDQSVAVIAKNVGYEDSQYFFRVFKKVTGMTPLQYRQGPRPDS